MNFILIPHPADTWPQTLREGITSDGKAETFILLTCRPEGHTEYTQELGAIREMGALHCSRPDS